MADDNNQTDGTVIPFPMSRIGPEGGLRLFMQFAENGDLVSAGQILAQVLEIEPKTGLAAATYFYNAVPTHPELAQVVRNLTADIAGGASANDTLENLFHCFGIQGPIAVNALQALRRSTTRLSS